MKNLGFPNDNLTYYAPAGRTPERRALETVRALEARFAGETFWPLDDEWIESDATPARDAFVEAHAHRILLTNRREGREHRFTFSFHDPSAAVRFTARHATAHFQLPETPKLLADATETTLILGEVLDAYWGEFTPEEAGYALLGQIVWPNSKPKPIPFDLPPLRPAPRLRGPEVPMLLGWINFWSPATCALLGFPDASRDARWLRGAKRGKSGAWVVRLTDDMLDPERNPEHVKALHDAYARFPEVGGRVEPR
jgi:hypothetical protein